MNKLFIPRAFFSCRSRLNLHEVSPGRWRTSCNSAWECIGCNGDFEFKSPVHPDSLKEVAKHEAPQVMEDWEVGNHWMRDEDIQRVLDQYPEEGYYWLRALYCDLDTIFIYRVEVKE